MAEKEVSKKTIGKRSFSKDTYLYWYESMQLMRKFEEKAGQLYGQQKIKGFCHLYIGQEACVAGAMSALGSDPKAIMAELYGKETGISKGKGGSMHMFDKENHFYGGHGIVGGQIPLGVGIAFAEKYNKTDLLCVTYMGDGAVRQGAFHEAFNLAMMYKLPVIFCIENNGYAMGTAVRRSSNVTELYKLGSAYDMPSKPVDAMSVEAVHIAMEEAAERARSGEGPTLLELRTYRYKGHSMSDPAKYRTKEELEEYKMKDPIEQVRKSLLDQKFATLEDLENIDSKVKDIVNECVEFAENSKFPDSSEAFKDVYAQEDYPYIKE
jgi:pyruvate dehydrogenase E1 component alpha subunit